MKNDLITALQEDIVLGRLAPGARLIEEELAERFRTKRHVLRGAFVELERFRANFEFDDALFAACGNPYLAAAIEYFRNAQREHRAMLRALRDGERRKLIELCAAHLDISRQAYQQTHRLRFAG